MLSSDAAPQNAQDGSIEDLVSRAGRGDEDAWRDILGLYGRRVFALARSRVRDDDLAEEITQSVFATVATKVCRDGYLEQGRFESWLFRIAANRVRDEFRRRKRHASPTDPAYLQDARTQEAASDGSASHEALRGALAMLNEQDREILELRHHGQMSFKQIGELLGQPVGTVLARHHRALKKLRTRLEASDDKDGAQHGSA